MATTSTRSCWRRMQIRFKGRTIGRTWTNTASAYTNGNMEWTSIGTSIAHGAHYAHPTTNAGSNIVAHTHSLRSNHALYEHSIQSSRSPSQSISTPMAINGSTHMHQRKRTRSSRRMSCISCIKIYLMSSIKWRDQWKAVTRVLGIRRMVW